MPGIFKRGEIYYTKFRTPKRFGQVESRVHVVISLKTRSRSEAQQLAPIACAEREILWARALGEDPGVLARRVASLAEALGHDYRTAPEIANMPTHELIARVKAVPPKAGPKAETTAALLGGVARERLRVSQLVDAYAALTEVARRPKTNEQNRVWRAARQRAARGFTAAVGDLPIEEITRDHARRWVATLQARLRSAGAREAGRIKVDSANKEIAYFSAMLNRTLDDRRLPNNFPFERLRIKNWSKDRATRLPIPDAHIRGIVLNAEAMAGLDPEAWDVLLAMVNTGARPSELIGLLPHHIRLDHPVPHIEIREEMRQLKTASSVREIPLVGVSFEAMQRRPDGFPRYRGRTMAWSGRVNAYLRKVQLPAPLTAYGLRHAFADRLIDAELSERIIADAMGHGIDRERYGQGLSLERRRAVLERVAYHP